MISYYHLLLCGITVDEEYTARVASAQEVEHSLIQKPQGM